MNNARKTSIRKRIALVAHDNKKAELIEWAVYNKAALSEHDLVATGTTGKMLEEELGRPVKRMLSGPLGGDQQIGARMPIAENIYRVLWENLPAQEAFLDIEKHLI